eukprot:m.46599 g.46599  ORF g.46599 m.46599 type:complete len:186 (-) comp10728_c2_seq3:888-1445(-)
MRCSYYYILSFYVVCLLILILFFPFPKRNSFVENIIEKLPSSEGCVVCCCLLLLFLHTQTHFLSLSLYCYIVVLYCITSFGPLLLLAHCIFSHYQVYLLVLFIYYCDCVPLGWWQKVDAIVVIAYLVVLYEHLNQTYVPFVSVLFYLILVFLCFIKNKRVFILCRNSVVSHCVRRCWFSKVVCVC